MTLATALNFAGMGISVLPLEPGSKAPYDRFAPHGFNDATTDAARITEWFETNPTVGLGVKPEELPDGRQFLVLDADDAESFDYLWDMFGCPTVLTAGFQKGAHAGGGHWYVILDEPISGLRKDTFKAYAALNIDLIGAAPSYVVAPPTRLVHGEYRWMHRDDPFIAVGTDHPLYLSLVSHVADDAEKHRAEAEQRAAARAARQAAGVTNENLNEWKRDTSLADRMVIAGWRFHRTASCHGGECEDWTHPFGASSPKSATLHVEGCAESKSDAPGGCLHLWSDNLPGHFGGNRSISTFDFVLWTDYDGDVAECRKGEGIPDEDGWGIGGMSFDPSEADTDTAAPPSTDADATAETDTATAETDTATAETDELKFAPRDPNSKVTGRVLADGKWIYDAVTAARCGWGTPAPVKDDGTVDESFSPWDRDMFPKGHPAAPDLLHKVFNFNDFTRAVFANARDISTIPTGPFALLSVELIRGIQRINPAFQPMPGTPAALTVLRAGESGKGKSTAMKAAKWTCLSGVNAGGVREAEDETHRLGSGQVLVQLMSDETTQPDPADPKKTIKVREQKDPCRVWLEDAEYRSVLKRAKGETSTLFDSLNEAWAGEHPGTASITNGWVSLNRPFNVNVSGGLQSQVWNLLMEQTTGFLQRVLMVGVSDPWRTLPDIIVDAPPPAPVSSVGFVTAVPVPKIPAAAQAAGQFALPPAVYAALERAQANASFEHTAADDEWESHLLQTRIRIACAMAVRCGTTVVTPEIWEWTGWVIEHHRRVIAWIQKAAAWRAKKERTDKGKELAEVKAAQKHAERTVVQNAAVKILDGFARLGSDTMTMRDARRFAKAYAEAVTDAVEMLVKDKLITIEPGARRDSQTLRLVNPNNSKEEK